MFNLFLHWRKFFYEKSHPGEFDPLNGLVLVDAVDFTSRDWKSDVLVLMVVDLAANAFWQFQVSWHAVNVDHPLVQGQVLGDQPAKGGGPARRKPAPPRLQGGGPLGGGI